MGSKKKSVAAKARDKAVEEIRETLEDMLSRAEAMVDAIQEALQAETPEDMIDAVSELDGTSIDKDAQNISTVEFPEADEDTE